MVEVRFDFGFLEYFGEVLEEVIYLWEEFFFRISMKEIFWKELVVMDGILFSGLVMWLEVVS